MNILLTGSTGYIGRRLLDALLMEGHRITCLVRSKKRFDYDDFSPAQLKRITIIECDLLDIGNTELPENIDIAYYLVHSLSLMYKGFKSAEQVSAEAFLSLLQPTSCKQIIYLGGIANDATLSEHLSSRKDVEKVLGSSKIGLTVLRSGVIIGSGSASFEIIRGLVEKLPVMITPKWLKSKSQPIGIRNIIEFLIGVAGKEQYYNQVYDIGTKEVLSYYQILMRYAKKRGLKRYILTVPVLTPRLSSLWLYFVTGTSFTLARNLVDSLTNDAIAKPNNLAKELGITLHNFEASLDQAFDKIRDNQVVSSWKDAIETTTIDNGFVNRIVVPKYGCFKDQQQILLSNNQDKVLDNFWNIGGDKGWYYGDFLWEIRGILDQAIGGVGLRRGRRSASELKTGDALDFWRVILANKAEKRLLLYAEMKLPGEAWLEFKIKEKEGQFYLFQTATFRPLGIIGRIYWYTMWPFHLLIFPGMAKNIVSA